MNIPYKLIYADSEGILNVVDIAEDKFAMQLFKCCIKELKSCLVYFNNDLIASCNVNGIVNHARDSWNI